MLVKGRGNSRSPRDTFSRVFSRMWASLTETLLPQRYLLELLEPVLLRRAVDHGIFQQLPVHAVVIDGRLDGAVGDGRLQLPRVAALAVHEARVVVTLVEELEHGGEYLGLLVGEGDAL